MHFLTLSDYTRDELDAMIDLALEVKGAPERYRTALQNKVLALLFLKHSTRTRVSFEAGMAQLGGSSSYLSPDTTQLGRGETLSDTVGSLSRYVDAIVARVFEPEQLAEIAYSASVPVINGLTNFDHPCQVLSDIVSILEHKRLLKGLNLTFIGAADNNIVNSLLHICPHFGVNLTISAPAGQSPNGTVVHAAQAVGKTTGSTIGLNSDPVAAVRKADVIYTDVWFSMHETPTDEGLALYKPYQVNADLMSKAPAEAIFMHCMPVHRGWEATDEVADSPQSIIFDQAENRLHTQKAILLTLLR
ncbi:ornithine carbamoyltransferase [Candidatus Poribacteria bacterium]|nr:ornithine carbamoyltransferase [Candidatus Poribacteria bacterium]